ncbi:MAG: quinolinate synthase NadA [bacterium]
MIIDKIKKLKEQRNAVILAHNYQIPEVQDIADHTGDSLELARKATQIDCDVIVFCGVRFMGETAHILSPEKTVLLPEPDAGCPLADMVDVEELREMKDNNPGATTICYVNSSAEVKAESDICCTSANAVKVVSSLNGSPIIFVPCRHLGGYVQKVTGKNLVLARGFCPTHHHISTDQILKLKNDMPDAKVLVHPECTTEVIDIADYVCSTSQMFKAIEESGARRFIVGTENGLLHPLRKRYPELEFFPPSEDCVCPNMKKITLEKVLISLETMEYKIQLDPDVRQRALGSLERMLLHV